MTIANYCNFIAKTRPKESEIAAVIFICRVYLKKMTDENKFTDDDFSVIFQLNTAVPNNIQVSYAELEYNKINDDEYDIYWATKL